MRRRDLWLSACSALAVFVDVTSVTPDPVRAAVVVDLPDIVVTAVDNFTPVTGSFEVLLTLTGGEATTPPQVGGYLVDFLATGTGLTFTGVTSTTTATPLLPSPLTVGLPTATLDPGWRATAADDIFPSEVPAFTGAGLLKVTFTIAAGNVGTTFPMTFDATSTTLTQFTNGDSTITYPDAGNTLTLLPGSITVAAVPEAAAWQFLSVAALFCVGAAYARRRWKSAPASR